MFIKVCGMRDSNNIHEVDILGVTMIGFIFYPLSPRYVSVKPLLPKYAKKVGVFVNQPVDDIIHLAKDWQLDYVQLHGNESPAYCQQLSSHNISIIKAFSIHSQFDWHSCNDYESVCKMFLFDTATAHYGGSGKKFDWHLLKYYQGNIPFLLSGGITIHDIDPLLQFSHIQFIGIDVNSGFEIAPGLKNIQQLHHLITQISPKYL